MTLAFNSLYAASSELQQPYGSDHTDINLMTYGGGLEKEITTILEPSAHTQWSNCRGHAKEAPTTPAMPGSRAHTSHAHEQPSATTFENPSASTRVGSTEDSPEV